MKPPERTPIPAQYELGFFWMQQMCENCVSMSLFVFQSEVHDGSRLSFEHLAFTFSNGPNRQHNFDCLSKLNSLFTNETGRFSSVRKVFPQVQRLKRPIIRLTGRLIV